MVRSLVTYGTQLWSPVGKADIVRLESIQRQASLYMVQNTDLDYISRLNQCNLLPLSYLREIYDLITFHNMMYDKLSIDISRYFMFDNDLRRGRSADKNFGIIKQNIEHSRVNPFTRTEYLVNGTHFLMISKVYKLQLVRTPSPYCLTML